MAKDRVAVVVRLPPSKRVGACWSTLFAKVSLKVVALAVLVFKKVVLLKITKFLRRIMSD